MASFPTRAALRPDTCTELKPKEWGPELRAETVKAGACLLSGQFLGAPPGVGAFLDFAAFPHMKVPYPWPYFSPFTHLVGDMVAGMVSTLPFSPGSHSVWRSED